MTNNKTVQPGSAPSDGLMRRAVVADPATVAATVARIRCSGRLIGMTVPQPLPDGRAHVIVTLKQLPNRAAKRSRRPAVAITVVSAAAAVIAGVAYAVAQLVQAAAEHRTLLVGTLVLLAAVALFMRRGHSATCTGIHCSGCKASTR